MNFEKYVPPDGFVNGLSFSPDGRFVASQGRDPPCVKLFHADTMRVLHVLTHPDFRSPDVAVQPLGVVEGDSRINLGQTGWGKCSNTSRTPRHAS
jgi:WD40 repeat protein